MTKPSKYSRHTVANSVAGSSLTSESSFRFGFWLLSLASTSTRVHRWALTLPAGPRGHVIMACWLCKDLSHQFNSHHSGHALLGEGPETGHSEDFLSLDCFGNTSVSQQNSWRRWSLFWLLTHKMDWNTQLNINGSKQATASITPEYRMRF